MQTAYIPLNFKQEILSWSCADVGPYVGPASGSWSLVLWMLPFWDWNIREKKYVNPMAVDAMAPLSRHTNYTPGVPFTHKGQLKFWLG